MDLAMRGEATDESSWRSSCEIAALSSVSMRSRASCRARATNKSFYQPANMYRGDDETAHH